MLPVASLLILVPLIFAAATFLTKTKNQAETLAFAGSLATLGLTLYAYLNFDSGSAAMQFFESISWTPSLGIKYSVGIDGISLPLILLNAIVTPLLILYSRSEEREASNRFYALILVMQAAVIGVFVSLDFFMFYIFWELIDMKECWSEEYWCYGGDYPSAAGTSPKWVNEIRIYSQEDPPEPPFAGFTANVT
ncbi:MAG: hypothetical protein PHD41_05860, partial [Methanosarcinaceae archaeon]|nr:hypothetical protein [Methanosarcinaceae archaeon]